MTEDEKRALIYCNTVLKGILSGDQEKPEILFRNDLENPELTNLLESVQKLNQQNKGESRFRKLFSDVPIPIAYISKTGEFKELNNRFIQTIGYTYENIPTIDEWWNLAFPEPDYRHWAKESWEQALIRAIENNTDIDSHEYRIICKNGEVSIFQVFGIILWDGFMVCFFDITERKLIEDDIKLLLEELNFSKEQIEYTLSQKNQVLEELSVSEAKLKETLATKDKFFSIIAHDLKNPFVGLIGLSDVLLELSSEIRDQNIQNIVKLINEASNKGYQLLINLLEWARMQTGRIKLEMQHFSVKELIAETIGIVATGALDKNITITTSGAEYIQVWSDKNILSTVLRNLLSNAVKYSNENGKISISVFRDNSKITISVKDHGMGIQKDDLDKLFRIDISYSTKGTKNESGTGLGLILCKDFINKLGGEIWVESEYQQGSTFFFTIPYNEGASIV